MKTLCIILTLLTATPAFAEPSKNELSIWWADWIEVCTTDKPWHLSDAERLKVCLKLEQNLRDYGRCMYSPKVTGIWNGTHCR